MRDADPLRRRARALWLVAAWQLAACGGQSVDAGGVSDTSGAPTGGVPGASSGGSVSSGGAGGTGGIRASGTGGVVAGSGGFIGAGGVLQENGGAVVGAGGFAGGASGTGGIRDAGVGGVTVDSSPGNSCSVSISTTTVTYGGMAGPFNIGAVWIEDATGAFVKTLSVWGRLRLAGIAEWWSVSGGNEVDAITGATRINEGPLKADWDCTNASGALVPNGSYFACVEFEEEYIFTITDAGPRPHYSCFPFNLSNSSASGTWPDQPNFVSVSWVLERT